MSIDEMHEFRMKIGGKTKAEQMAATGAEIVVSPCANCKKQLDEVIADYELPMERKGLHDLLLRSIVMPNGQTAAQTGDEEPQTMETETSPEGVKP